MSRAVSIIAAFALLAVAAIGQARNPDYRSPEHAEGATTISVDEAKWMFDEGAAFIDVRNPRFFARRHVPGSHHLDLKDNFTEESLAAVAGKDQPIVIYSSGVKCSRGHRAAELAATWGYKKVYYFRGGIVDWRDVQYPLKSSTQ
jgi:rhodanese-related sulfurtransferase